MPDEAPSAAPEPVLIRATVDTLPGAALVVGGLSVVERAIRQRAALPGARVSVLSDGKVPLPVALPPNAVVADANFAGPALDAAVPANLVDPAGRPGTGAAPILVTDEATRARAEDAIFAELLRGDLGLVARYLNKPISFRLTRHVFCRLPFSPNQITLGAGLVGLVGAAFISMGSYAAVVLGFFLAHVQSILDGCDGELARVRFQRSAIGEWLDTFVDDGLNLALVAALARAVQNPARTSLPMAPILAWIAFGMLLFYNLVCYRELIRQGEGGSVLKVRWWFARGADMKAMAGKGKPGIGAFLYNLGRRDVFVLAWLILAAADRLGVIVLFAFVVAAVSFIVAAGQLLTTREA
ncbi:MAG TPA: CDP-alcohol phosphatidyltransferase family protein [Polyangia bacterium]|nr:CDP-alcohol phosphatidyltransferase family protein [Polyangia bacterium]